MVDSLLFWNQKCCVSVGVGQWIGKYNKEESTLNKNVEIDELSDYCCENMYKKYI